jgi:hypothetical protein
MVVENAGQVGPDGVKGDGEFSDEKRRILRKKNYI